MDYTVEKQRTEPARQAAAFFAAPESSAEAEERADWERLGLEATGNESCHAPGTSQVPGTFGPIFRVDAHAGRDASAKPLCGTAPAGENVGPDGIRPYNPTIFGLEADSACK